MKSLWDPLFPYLPADWFPALEALPRQFAGSVQELRLRAGEPVTLSTPRGEWFLSREGATQLRQRGLVLCSVRQLEACLLRFCEDSLYAHEAELRQGFIAVPGGIRVGVAGEAVTDGSRVRAVRQVTSLCIRLPRNHAGCAAGLLGLVLPDGALCNALLVGEPSSGKTSLLRDLAAALAARRFRVAVVDERGELAGVNGLPGCDVLRGYDKATGMAQAVRCLAPQVIVFDELGDEREAEQVAACSRAGAAVIASLHGRRPQELANRPLVKALVRGRCFDRWIFLAGRQTPGVMQSCWIPEEKNREIFWHAVGDSGRERTGTVFFPAVVPSGVAAGAGAAAAEHTGAAAAVHREAAGGPVAGAGGNAGLCG